MFIFQKVNAVKTGCNTVPLSSESEPQLSTVCCGGLVAGFYLPVTPEDPLNAWKVIPIHFQGTQGHFGSHLTHLK